MKPENPFRDIKGEVGDWDVAAIWQQGGEAYIKWLNEPCKEHPRMIAIAAISGKTKRIDCLDCREEIGLDS